VGRGAATLSTVACVTQQQVANTRASIVACMFRGFCGLTVLAWGKHATIFMAFQNINTLKEEA
jgi:hypothetical protein